MKKLILLSGFLLISIFTFAQEKPVSYCTFGVSRAFYQRDHQGTHVFAEYNQGFTKHFSVAPFIFAGRGFEVEEYPNYNSANIWTYSFTGLGVAARFIPLPKLFRRLKLDFTVYYRCHAEMETTINSYNPKDWYLHLMSSILYYENQFGTIIAANIDVISSEKLIVGLRAERMLGFSMFQETSNQLGIYIGRKF